MELRELVFNTGHLCSTTERYAMAKLSLQTTDNAGFGPPSAAELRVQECLDLYSIDLEDDGDGVR